MTANSLSERVSRLEFEVSRVSREVRSGQISMINRLINDEISTYLNKFSHENGSAETKACLGFAVEAPPMETPND